MTKLSTAQRRIETPGKHPSIQVYKKIPSTLGGLGRVILLIASHHSNWIPRPRTPHNVLEFEVLILV
jgi:hypothetical protein